jgi:hypothetical protein
MKRRYSLPLVAAIALLATQVQAVMVEVPLEQTADKAVMIVQGTVVDQVSHWTSDGRTIVTDVTLRIADAIKGAAKAGGYVTFQVEGGEVGEIGIWVEHQPRFTVDQDVLVFLRPGDGGTLAVQHAELGRYTLFGDKAYDYRGRVQEVTRLKADIRMMVDRPGR